MAIHVPAHHHGEETTKGRMVSLSRCGPAPDELRVFGHQVAPPVKEITKPSTLLSTVRRGKIFRLWSCFQLAPANELHTMRC